MGLHILAVPPEPFLLLSTEYGRYYFVVALCGLCLIFMVPLVCLLSVIVAFPGDTRLLSD